MFRKIPIPVDAYETQLANYFYVCAAFENYFVGLKEILADGRHEKFALSSKTALVRYTLFPKIPMPVDR